MFLTSCNKHCRLDQIIPVVRDIKTSYFEFSEYQAILRSIPDPDVARNILMFVEKFGEKPLSCWKEDEIYSISYLMHIIGSSAHRSMMK